MRSMERELGVAVSLARRAGELLRRGFGDPELLGLRRTAKALTTPYDLSSNRLLVEGLSSEFPSHNLWTEETGRVDRGSPYTWLVDPLDGTTNFASGNPLFCVSLALLEGEEPVLGVVYLPVLDELFLARRGEGAWLERGGKEVPLSVSGVEELGGAYLYFCEGSERSRERTGRINSLLYPRVRDLRKLGSAGVEACWVACGRGDAYVTTAIQPWDVAASVLVVEEAGGRVTDFSGEGWRPEALDLVFSNGRLHGELLELLGREGVKRGEGKGERE